MPFVNRDGSEIYYETHGDGPALLFCSVTGLDHQAWKFHQVPEFSRDHKVILFDYRGTGKSSKRIENYSIKMFTDDAAAILDHLKSSKRSSAATPWAAWSRSCLALDYPHQGQETDPRLQRLCPPRRPWHPVGDVPRHGARWI